MVAHPYGMSGCATGTSISGTACQRSVPSVCVLRSAEVLAEYEVVKQLDQSAFAMTGLRVALLALALLHVSVAQEPTLQVLPSNILKPLGDKAYVSCSAVVDNPELVTEMHWSGPNGQEIPNAEGTIIALESIEGSGKLDLMIQNLREEDSGEYECTAVYAGNQKLSVKLMVDFFGKAAGRVLVMVFFSS
ncbi:fasciclin-2-like [Penaeus indicus]|uniref:fasciclin-2-like n=1 Tax=Penaeus indicus TaxID=29960 RepID=UPI00300DB2B1